MYAVFENNALYEVYDNRDEAKKCVANLREFWKSEDKKCDVNLRTMTKAEIEMFG